MLHKILALSDGAFSGIHCQVLPCSRIHQPLRTTQAQARSLRVQVHCAESASLERGSKVYNHLADGLDVLTRLPVFARESGSEYAQQFVARCQRDKTVFTEAVASLCELIDLPKPDALAVLRKNPGIILVPPAVLAGRTLQLKLTLPASDLRAVVQRAPWLLTEEDGVEQAALALRKLKALMPALPVEARLLEDGLWQSFMSLLRDQHAFR